MRLMLDTCAIIDLLTFPIPHRRISAEILNDMRASAFLYPFSLTTKEK